MRLSLHPCTSQPMLALLSLIILTSAPWSVTSYPRLPAAVLPALDGPDWKEALLRLQTALDVPEETGHLVQPGPWATGPRDPQVTEPVPDEEVEGGWGREELLRAQRGDLLAWPLSPFPGSHSLDSLHYQEGGEQGEGGKRNEALTSIVGGLQAFSREKGGFGFRFGKRWNNGTWRGGWRGRAEEEG